MKPAKAPASPKTKPAKAPASPKAKPAKAPASPALKAAKEPKVKKEPVKEKKEKKEKKVKKEREEKNGAARRPTKEDVPVPGAKSLEDVEGLSPKTRELLAAKGFATLFEIQHKVFSNCFKGSDTVGKAKTGCGKTLAFVLPCVERIVQNNMATMKRGRSPLVSVLAPTRELARQIYNDFDYIASGHGLVSLVLYGGTLFGPQVTSIKDGIDIVVATPGRLLDHLKRETINLGSVKMFILDEADEMLNMGFQEDVETALRALNEPVQKLLFSATLPSWVNELVEKYLKKPKTVDVTSKSTNRTNENITHQCISCPWQQKADALGDLVKVHAGSFGKTVVFCQTKSDVNELAGSEKLMSLNAAALHGDIPQQQRDVALDNFRAGKVKCLVATDVAARGLDIPMVDLVVMMKPPQDTDSYVHRAGRTARAGKKGTCVVFFTKNEEFILRKVEQDLKIKFERVGPPQPKDIVAMAVEDAVKIIDTIHQDTVDAFYKKAKSLIEKGDAASLLAGAMAAMTGYTEKMNMRSLITGFEGYTAFKIASTQGIPDISKAWRILRSGIGYDVAQTCKAMTLCTDGYSACFDVPADALSTVKNAQLWEGETIEVVTELPEMEQEKGKGKGKGKSKGKGNNYYSNSDGKGKGKGKGKGESKGKGKGKGSTPY